MCSVLSYVHSVNSTRSFLPDSIASCSLVDIFQNFCISCMYFSSVSLCKVLFLCFMLMLVSGVHWSSLVCIV